MFRMCIPSPEKLEHKELHNSTIILRFSYASQLPSGQVLKLDRIQDSIDAALWCSDNIYCSDCCQNHPEFSHFLTHTKDNHVASGMHELSIRALNSLGY